MAEDQVMVEVMTDKATVTIGAPRAGKIDKLMRDGRQHREGRRRADRDPDRQRLAHGGRGLPAATAVGDIRDSLPGTSYFGEKRAVAESRARRARGGATREPRRRRSAARRARGQRRRRQRRSHYAEKPLATPATRKLARDLKVDLQRVPGSGPHGRVTHEDVLAHSSAGGVAGAERAHAAARQRPAAARAASRAAAAPPRRGASASRSSGCAGASPRTCAVEEHGRALHLRGGVRGRSPDRAARAPARPTPRRAASSSRTCRSRSRRWSRRSRSTRCSTAASTRRSNELVLHDRYHIGIAAATDQGLVVPVIHDADQRSACSSSRPRSSASATPRATARSRARSCRGSTFTITSLGKQAGLFAVPIINFPNVGILGLHRMKERPVVRDGQIAIGQVMLLSLSLDHRIVDGHVGAAFAYDVIHYLEDPARLAARELSPRHAASVALVPRHGSPGHASVITARPKARTAPSIPIGPRTSPARAAASYACASCWHPAVERCHACLARDPTAAAPPLAWEQRDKPAARALLRHAGERVLAVAHRARVRARRRRRRAALHAALGAAARAAAGVIPHTRTLMFEGNFAVRVIGHPSRAFEIALDVLRAMLRAGRADVRSQLACLLLPFASLVRAYAPARRSAALRVMYYRIWLLPAALLFFYVAMWMLPTPDPAALQSAPPTGVFVRGERAAARVGAADDLDGRDRAVGLRPRSAALDRARDRAVHVARGGRTARHRRPRARAADAAKSGCTTAVCSVRRNRAQRRGCTTTRGPPPPPPWYGPYT